MAWESSETVGEVAEKCSRVAGKPYSAAIASARAAVYRKAGVRLKEMGPMEHSNVNV